MREVTLRIALAPETERLALRALDLLGDLRDQLSRIGWNAAARVERDTGPGATSPARAEGAAIDGGAPHGMDARPAGAMGIDVHNDRGDGAACVEMPAASVPQPAGEAVASAPRSPAPADPPGWRPGPGGRKWTTERDDLLARMHAAGATRVAILAAVNALPGEPISSPAGIATRVKERKLAQGRRDRQPAPPAAAAPAQDAAPETPPPAPPPLPRVPFLAGASDLYTPARLDLARRLVAERAPWTEVRDAMNRLPGLPLASADAVAARLWQLGIRRPAAPVEGARVLRSTARPAVLLTGHEPSRRPPAPPPAPFRPAPAELAERDGALSPARQQMRQDAAAAAAVPITLADALLWGVRNQVAPLRDERPMQHFLRVNARREQLGLPRFTLIAPRPHAERLPHPSVTSVEAPA